MECGTCGVRISNSLTTGLKCLVNEQFEEIKLNRGKK